MKLQGMALVTVSGAFAFIVRAWDYESHHAINELAVASLPKNFGIELISGMKGICKKDELQATSHRQ